uniref:UBC core domain-containing protein n=1 Tax=Meloidogyne incognita TaxID=6306 RepID=A0A914MJH7_MELIC
MNSENSQRNSSVQNANELNSQRSTGVKRLLNEAKELCKPNELFHAQPLEENLFEWHFTVRGPPDTVYSEGVYHGRILLPVEYPMKPPNLRLLTPNGRFETNKNICLSISGYHPETWLPSWSIRTALLALIGFMPTHSAGALGSLECSPEERQRLAIMSLDWNCPQCGIKMRDVLPQIEKNEDTKRLIEEVKNVSCKQTVPLEENSSSPEIASTLESIVREVVDASEDNLINAPPLQIEESTQQQISINNNILPNTQQQQQLIQPSSRPFLLENPLIWIFVLSILFFALFFRRLLSQNIGDEFKQKF